MEGLQVNLTDIKRMVDKGEYTEALNKIDILLEQDDETYYEALRIRAYIYNLKESYPKALQDRLEIVRSEQPKLKDYFLAAYEALYTKDYLLARDLLMELLEKGRASDNNWFDSAAYFLLAYCYMVEGDYEAANKNLNISEAIEKDVSIPIPLVTKSYNVNLLRSEIEKKQGSGGGI